MRRVIELPGLATVAIVRLYQVTLARLVPGRCRFHPSCSSYAIAAIRGRGLVRGGALALWRLARCGPWTTGGVDPVPQRAAEASGG